MVSIKRVYDRPDDGDGQRVLVDRLWPRGLSKARAAIDLWLKDISPSAELRTWFDHDVARWEDFRRRYAAELAASPAMATLRALAREGRVTLVYGAKDTLHNNAVVLKDLLSKRR